MDLKTISGTHFVVGIHNLDRDYSEMRRTAFCRHYFHFHIFTGCCFCQEFRSTTTVTSNNQPVTLDLSNVSDVRGASITLHNSSSGTISLPQISTPNNLMPISGAAILKQLNGLPLSATDQDRADSDVGNTCWTIPSRFAVLARMGLRYRMTRLKS